MDTDVYVFSQASNMGAYLMKNCCKILEEEVRIIKKIQQDETWLEGERRHCEVSPEDQKVKERAEQVILEHLQDIEREALYHCYDENNKDCQVCKRCIIGE